MDGDALDPGGYRVLARKHRPQTFDALIGQDALVRVLSNAFELDRVPHAMILTGVRGVGKTTTARIIAKGLNCLNADGPTRSPCGVCDNCVAISESRHPDVLEMDAASRTGIDDIREIIESVRYRAAQGRYKVYIVDETHMLSKNAFNGLLKTLEEPPPHVVFILATTDIHKVPVTVLSRCMRFDLRRVPPERMAEHLADVAAQEAISLEPDALALLAQASEGSVRDALSLLDQASAHAAAGAAVTAASVREMLGLADRTRVFDLFEHLLRGRVADALRLLQELYRDGADPVAVLKDLAEACHLSAMGRAAPERLEDPALAPAERERAAALAEAFAMRVLTRAWQMLLKSIEEAAQAPSAIAAAEMALIRMAYVADLPSPEEALKRLEALGSAGQGAPAGGGGAGPTGGDGARALKSVAGAGSAAPSVEPTPRPNASAAAGPATFEALVADLSRWREAKLLVDVEQYVRPGPLAPGRFEFTPADGAPQDLAARLGEALRTRTGVRWVVSVSDDSRAQTIAERRSDALNAEHAAALADPGVQAAIAAFPGATLASARLIDAAQPDVEAEADDTLFEGLDPGSDAEAEFFATAGYEPAYLHQDVDDEDDEL